MTEKLGSNCTARVGIRRKRQGCVSLNVNKDLFGHPLFKSIQSECCIVSDVLWLVLFYQTLNWQEQQSEIEN